MFSTVKRCIHTKFGWIWSSDQSARNKFSFKSVENWNFAGSQKASKQAETNDVLNRSESLTSWEFIFLWIFKIGQLLLFKQLTSNMSELHKFWLFNFFYNWPWLIKLDFLSFSCQFGKITAIFLPIVTRNYSSTAIGIY